MGVTPLDGYGRHKVVQVVSSFYGDVLRSKELGPYFANVHIAGLVEHQALFMAMMMGGPASFTDEQIREVHANLGISDEHFEEMLRLLEQALLRYDVTVEDAADVVARYRTYLPHVVGSSAANGD
ncbi:MAG TPA: group 1 truncated hemoglobin [Acidimicrobiia bacterium]|jgi:hemoglobin